MLVGIGAGLLIFSFLYSIAANLQYTNFSQLLPSYAGIITSAILLQLSDWRLNKSTQKKNSISALLCFFFGFLSFIAISNGMSGLRTESSIENAEIIINIIILSSCLLSIISGIYFWKINKRAEGALVGSSICKIGIGFVVIIVLLALFSLLIYAAERPHIIESGKNIQKKTRQINELIKANPEDASNYFFRGKIYADNYHYEEALNDFKKALSIRPNFSIANNFICYVYINKEQYGAAENYCKKAIEQAENFSEPHYNLARIYKFKGDFKNAIDEATKFINLKKDSCEGYFLRGECYFIEKEYLKASNDFKKVMEFKPPCGGGGLEILAEETQKQLEKLK